MTMQAARASHSDLRRRQRGSAPTLVSIAVTPSSQSTEAGSTQQYVATGTYSDSTTGVITSTVTWDTSDHAVATIASGGLLTAVLHGSCTVTATLGAVSGSTSAIVTRTLTSITVTPGNASLNDISTGQYTATGHYNDSSTSDLTGSVTWDTSDHTLATVAAGGLASGLAPGSVTVTATSGAVSGNTTLTITGMVALMPDPRVGVEGGLGITQSSDVISIWSDQSGQGNHFTQASSGNRLVWVHDGSGPGGRPYCQGSHTASRYMTAADAASLRPTNYTWFCVTRSTATISAYYALFGSPSNPATWADRFACANDGLGHTNTVSPWNGPYNTGLTANATLTVNTWYVLEATFDGTTLSFWVNGTLIGTKAASLTYGATALFALLALVSGAGPTFNYAWPGDVAGFWLNGTSMSSGTRSTARVYLGSKYSITVTP